MLRRIPTTCATKFHSDLRLSAAPRRYYAIPRRAPSTRRAIARQNAQSGKGGAAIDSSTSLPSLSLLTEARASGVLSIEPGHALRFLEAYVALGREVDASRVKTLCAGHKVPLDSLPDIAFSLSRSSHEPHRALARHIIFSASSLRLPRATYYLISAGLQNRDALLQSQLQPAIEHLSSLASAGTDFRALILWGRVLLKRGYDRHAAKCFQKVVDDDVDDDDDDDGNHNNSHPDRQPAKNTTMPVAKEEPFLPTKAEAYTLLAAHHLQQNQPSLAAPLALHAATTSDAPHAWAVLAQAQPADSPQQAHYYTHAAAHGHLDAAQRLGKLYLRRWSRDPVRTKTDDDNWRWAQEWLGVSHGAMITDDAMRALCAVEDGGTAAGRERR